MTVKAVLRFVLAAFMVYAGIMHFAATDSFAAVVPNYLPDHRLLVQISGVFEILGGLGLLVRRTRRIAAWGLIVLYVAVFPANINMAMHDMPIGGHHHPLLLWLRLPLQGVLIAWAWWYARGSQD